MRVNADFHIHSHFSQATSKNLTIPNLEKYARLKGLHLLGTGDLTHPGWLKEIKPQLTDNGDGILETETGFRFVLSGEISLIYTEGGKGRRIHLVLLAPGFDVAQQIQEALLTFGRIDYDGRPIFGRRCPEVVETLKSIDDSIEIIPAHIWTPWFSLFGSRSGFDTVEECFQDQTRHIYAMETGLSSDPAMNWRLSQLDKYTLVSNSDAHSYWPWRIGRECNVIDLKDWRYRDFINILRTGEGMIETVEFWPDEGKYHYDGHRKCGILFSPEQSEDVSNICPECRQPLTIGVAHRVHELADRPEGFRPKGAVPFRNLIPLHEIISGAEGKGVATQTVWKKFHELIKVFDNEMRILLEISEPELRKVTTASIARLIVKSREQEIPFTPGYDGVYGVPDFSEILNTMDDAEQAPVQKGLGEFL